MRFALLGIDNDALKLVRAIRDETRHLLVAAYELNLEAEDESLYRQFGETLPGVPRRDDWEPLLHSTNVDGVIVAATRRQSDESQTAQRDDCLRKLAQAGIAMLLVHPACKTLLTFELDMIRQDTNCPLAVYYPGIEHPALAKLAELAKVGRPAPSAQISEGTRPEQSGIGVIEQLIFERSLPTSDLSKETGQQHSLGMSDRESVLFQLTRDAALIREVLGDMKQVSAMKTEQTDTLSGLTISMANEEGIPVRWSLVGKEQDVSARITLIGSLKTARLIIEQTSSDSEGGWLLHTGDETGGIYYQPLHEENNAAPAAGASTAITREAENVLAEFARTAWRSTNSKQHEFEKNSRHSLTVKKLARCLSRHGNHRSRRTQSCSRSND